MARWWPSRSVALPLPSSPHWAPRTTIAGIGTSSRSGTVGPRSVTGAGQGHARARTRNSTGALAAHVIRAGRSGRRARVRPVDPLLLITNADAGSADDESLERGARRCCARRARRRGRSDLQPRRARRRAAPRAASAGSWWPAATAACTPWSPRCTAATSSTDAVRRPAAAGHRQRLRPRRRASRSTSRRPRGWSSTGEVRADGPDRRRARRGRGQQRARRGRRPGQPHAAPAGRTGSAGRRRQGQPRQARLPDRRRPRRSTRRSCGCASRWTARSSPTSTSRC